MQFPNDQSFPLDKPHEIVDLEELDKHVLESMTQVEIDEKVETAAIALARKCKEQVKQCSYETCVEMVSIALETTGSGIGGRVGNHLIACNQTAAETACRLVFPKNSN